MTGCFRGVGDAVALAAVSGVLVSVALPMMAADRDRSRRGKDASQFRQIHQALTIWAGAHNGAFPLPSAIDAGNRTIAAAPDAQRTKDNTGNIFSLLIYNGLLMPATCVSPVETSSFIAVDREYEYANPRLAASPGEALWDPGFAGTLSDTGRRSPGKGSFSYAHVPPFNQRLAQWGSAFAGPIVANRGPKYEATNSADEAPYPVGNTGWQPTTGSLGVNSNTMKFYLDPWRGHVLFGDGRVVFEARADPQDYLYRTSLGVRHPDNIFVNESDDATRPSGGSGGAAGTNAYMRLISSVRGVDSAPQVLVFID